MKKLIFGIFAHPDDEAFGPAGTFLHEVAAGNEVHLITLTAGEAGRNPDNHADLAEVRLKEWRETGTLIGATSMHFLGYKDSQLCTKSLEEIIEKIESLIREIIADRDEPYEFLAFDLNGISGHIDHIVASRAAAAVFYRLKKSANQPLRLRLYCIPKQWMPDMDVSWLYKEAGCDECDIDETVDAREHLGTIKTIIKTHHSQREDAAIHLARTDETLYLNHFKMIQ